MPTEDSEFRINIDAFTLGEVDEVEEIVGKPLTEILSRTLSAKALIALTYIAKRKDNPDFTLDDARAIPLSGILIGGETDPTDAASESS